MRDDVIVVFGGSGFLGAHVVRALAKAGKRVRVAMRQPHLGGALTVNGAVGQIQIVQANVRYPDSIAAALDGADGVVNLVGVLHEHGAQNFRALHEDAPIAIAEAAAKAGVKRMVHMSALGAAKKGARYARTKFAGEEGARAALPSAVILRPSVMFGPEDTFFNRFADLARLLSYLPPLFNIFWMPGGKTKFQPVFAGNVADAVVAALDEPRAQGRIFELGGPRVYTFRELLDFVRSETDRNVPLVPIPFVVAHPFGLLTQWAFAPIPFAEAPITEDQVAMLHRDNVVSEGAEGFAALGISSLENVEAIVPAYLWRYRPYGQFQTKQSA